MSIVRRKSGSRRRTARVLILLGALPALAAIWLASPGPGSAAARSAGGLGQGSTGSALARAARPALDAFYRSPVLVRAGEAVRIPVEIGCVTPQGSTCPASAALEIRGDAGWARVGAAAVAGLEFDVSAPATRAAGSALEYRIRAIGPSGASLALPARGAPLRLHVAREMDTVAMPTVPFGVIQEGDVVLDLPWGTGPRRAGLVPGEESATTGPPAFAVDGLGRIHVIDAMQGRLAVFLDGHLVRETALPLTPRSDIALGPDGVAHVVTGSTAGQPSLVATRIDEDGRAVGRAVRLGPGILSEVRDTGPGAAAHVLPLDAWVPLRTSAARGSAALSVGRPLDGGRSLLKAIVGDSVRLGIARGGHVADAVEIRSPERLGELALAERLGRGYLAVVRVWRDDPSPAAQFQVLRIAADRRIATFAVADRSYAEAMPLSRFRLGDDGHLYQLTTSPEGMRIVRFRIGG